MAKFDERALSISRSGLNDFVGFLRRNAVIGTYPSVNVYNDDMSGYDVYEFYVFEHDICYRVNAVDKPTHCRSNDSDEWLAVTGWKDLRESDWFKI